MSATITGSVPEQASNPLSPSHTLIDLQAEKDKASSVASPPASEKGAERRASSTSDATVASVDENDLSNLPPMRKNILLLCFCLAMFIDAAGVSATFLMTDPIAKDLGISYGDYAWVLGTYSLAFASTLLFAGRLADLYSPSVVYTIGFAGLGIFYLIISFMTDQYAFFVLRAISALLAVLTIPSSINMIVQMYPDPTEQAKKLTLFGMAGALANTIALILAGLFLLASWRWYFRFIAILVIPFSVVCWFLMPRTKAVAQSLPGAEKWKRMDLGGVFIMVAMLILFILAFTQGPVKGWDKPIFIAPLVVAIVLLPVFLIWEAKMPRHFSLIPHDIYKFPNILPLLLQASSGFLWFATFQLRVATYFQEAHHNSPILAAVKLLPMGITALFVGGIISNVPQLITRPRYVQVVASALCFTGSMLLAFSKGGFGSDYWKFIFTGEIIGTVGGMIVFIGMNTALIQSFPLEFAGVGGSFANVIFQVGGVIGIAIQQGLLSTGDTSNPIDWTGSKNGYFFSSAYVMATGIIFVILYRQHKAPQMSQGAVAV